MRALCLFLPINKLYSVKNKKNASQLEHTNRKDVDKVYLLCQHLALQKALILTEVEKKSLTTKSIYI